MLNVCSTLLGNNRITLRHRDPRTHLDAKNSITCDEALCPPNGCNVVHFSERLSWIARVGLIRLVILISRCIFLAGFAMRSVSTRSGIVASLAVAESVAARLGGLDSDFRVAEFEGTSRKVRYKRSPSYKT